MPATEPIEEDSSEEEFVLEGFAHLSRGRCLDSDTPSNAFEKDLKTYERKAKDYCHTIRQTARRENKSNLVFPDPLTFWKIQVKKTIFISNFFAN